MTFETLLQAVGDVACHFCALLPLAGALDKPKLNRLYASSKLSGFIIPQADYENFHSAQGSTTFGASSQPYLI